MCEDLLRHYCGWREIYERSLAGPDPVIHGTRRCYQRGCKCPDCRAANAAYDRERRKLRTLPATADSQGSLRDSA